MSGNTSVSAGYATTDTRFLPNQQILIEVNVAYAGTAGNERTVRFRFVSPMTTTSYRRKIRTLYLFLTLTFKNPRTHPCLLYVRKLMHDFQVSTISTLSPLPLGNIL